MTEQRLRANSTAFKKLYGYMPEKNEEINRVAEMLKNPAYLHVTCVRMDWVDKYYGGIEKFLDALEKRGINASAKDGKYSEANRLESNGYYIVRKSARKGYCGNREINRSKPKTDSKKLRPVRSDFAPRPKNTGMGKGNRSSKVGQTFKQPRQIIACNKHGEIIHIYHDAQAVCDAYGIQWRSSVYKCCNKGTKSRIAGVYFKWGESNEYGKK